MEERLHCDTLWESLKLKGVVHFFLSRGFFPSEGMVFHSLGDFKGSGFKCVGRTVTICAYGVMWLFGMAFCLSSSFAFLNFIWLSGGTYVPLPPILKVARLTLLNKYVDGYSLAEN